MTKDEAAATPSQLSLADAVSLVVGIVVGTAIFRSTAEVFSNCRTPGEALGLWGLGGLLALNGALCYAELGTTYPRSGGDYVYLTRAYGAWAGFLFGWLQLTAILASSIGAMAFALADYAARLVGWGAASLPWLAAAAVAGLSLANAGGARWGPRTQNLLTVAKVGGLALVLAAGAGIFLGIVDRPTLAPPAAPTAEPADNGVSDSSRSLGLAMVFVLFAYGGWNDAAFVAAEVRDRRRNVPRALVGGVALITLLYLAMNGAYLAALGFARVRTTATPAAEVLEAAAGPGAAQLVSGLVMVSALGAINGMIFTGSRLYAALGEDHPALAWLGRRTGDAGIPRAALAAQAAATLTMILAVGSERGRRSVDGALALLGVPAIPWERYFGGFETLVAATAPLFWGLFAATGAALMVLRNREPQRDRPFAVPFYPLPPLAFVATCLFMLYHSLAYARWLTALGALPAAVGLAIYAASHPSKRS